MSQTLDYLMVTKLIAMVILATTIIPWWLIYTMNSFEGRLNKYLRWESARCIVQFLSMLAIVLLYSL